METFIIMYLLILGSLIGSFLNVVAIRIPKGESILLPPSHCTACNTRLRVFDLIPVFSYLFLRGKCRYCGVRVSLLYPMGELITAFLFLVVYQYFGFSYELLVALTLISILVVITISDLLYQIIPNKVIFFGIAVFLLLRLLIHPLPLTSYLLGFILGGGIFLLIAIISRGGMGGGDIKLMAMLGLVLGWELTLVTIILSSFIGSIIGGGLLLLGKIKRKQPIPFGPFIAAGAFISYIWGFDLIDHYLASLL